MTDNAIQSQTTADNAPDRFERQTLGGVDCHYALMANTNVTGAAEPQQDRLSVSSLPGISASQFRDVMKDSFEAMKESDARLWSNARFRGNSSVTLTLLDPKSGKLAIGSKGDAASYILLRHRTTPDRMILRRISSPHEEYARPPSNETFPNSLHTDSVPVMYAQPDSWNKSKEALTVSGLLGKSLQSFTNGFRLIDLPELAQSVIDERAGRGGSKGSWRDYDISVICASDGLSHGMGPGCDRSLRDLFQKIPADTPNQAEKLAAMRAHAPAARSADNIAIAMLNNIALGSGEPVAVCVADGASLKRDKNDPEGNAHAQAMIEAFEKTMAKIREKSGAGHTGSIARDGSGRRL